MKKNKYTYLLKNIGLLTLSSFGSKILSFILIPLYTKILTTTEYGTYDIYSTTISLLTPILTINIIDSVMRFSLDDNSDKNDVFTIGLKRIVVSIICFIGLVLINNRFKLIPVLTNYSIYLVLLFSFGIIYSLFSQFSRGIEKIKVLAFSGILNSLATIIANIILLVVYKQGLRGYFISTIIGYIIPGLYLFFRLKIWKYISTSKKEEKRLKNEMELYSKPLIFNTLSWWVNNVSDRYIVTWLCGIAANGIYSIAYKIPSVLNMFQSIFTQAWTLSAVKEFEKKNEQFYTNIYNICNIGMVGVCSLLIIFDKLISRILFSNDFYSAWKYAPFLMISVVFGSLSGMLGGVFSAAMKSKEFAKTTFIGAIINIVLNIILVYLIGPVGAAISTMITYVVVWSTRLVLVNKIIKINNNIYRDAISYVVLIIQSVLLIYIKLNSIVLYSLEFVLFIVIVCLYIKEIVIYTKKIFKREVTVNVQ